MKEIKFRAWATESKKMLEVIQLELFKDGSVVVNGRGGSISNPILMQFTGLKDKNGVEIYEGDIVRWNPWQDGRMEGWKTGQIWWCDDSDGWRIKENYLRTPISAYNQIEVIGNIYEYPNLLTPKG